MKEVNGEKLYSMNEVAHILGISSKRVYNASVKRSIIASDVEAWRGREGFRYLFNEAAINEYGRKIGVKPIFENYILASKMSVAEKQKHLQAMRDVDELQNGRKKDDGILITADNVKQVFEDIQSNPQSIAIIPEEKYTETQWYALKLGKAYVNKNSNLTTVLDKECFVGKLIAEEMKKLYGATVLKIYLKEVAE